MEKDGIWHRFMSSKNSLAKKLRHYPAMERNTGFDETDLSWDFAAELRLLLNCCGGSNVGTSRALNISQPSDIPYDGHDCRICSETVLIRRKSFL